MFKKIPLAVINGYNKNTLMETLGIECIEIGEDFLVSTMPVDARNHQPMGLLHGGASVALIESIGSMGSSLLLDLEKEYPVGLEVNANHVGGIKSGMVKAIGKIVHAGKKTHVWQVDVFDYESNKMVATGRLTVLIIQK
ncbi:MAG: hotdog fold thioesterase [Crocinitomicaceae bacterium]|nr:hotdog fold thioesterase [Crocinitomicaceae bacterium]